MSRVHSVVQVVGEGCEAGWRAGGLAGWQTCRLAVGLKVEGWMSVERKRVSRREAHTHTGQSTYHHLSTITPVVNSARVNAQTSSRKLTILPSAPPTPQRARARDHNAPQKYRVSADDGYSLLLPSLPLCCTWLYCAWLYGVTHNIIGPGRCLVGGGR